MIWKEHGSNMRSQILPRMLSWLWLLVALGAVPGCLSSSADSLPTDRQPIGATANKGETETTALATQTSAAKNACCEKSSDTTAATKVDDAQVQPIAGGVVLPDVSLVDQDGRIVHFPDDLVHDKIVAMNFIFTTCKGICPPMSANFAALQRRLGDRFGQDVVLISVSVDPTIDTPERLSAWRTQFGGGPGWTLLTGQKQNVDFLLKELEVFAADKNDHSPFILLGDVAAGKWSRVHGLTAPEKLVEIIAELHSAKVISGGRIGELAQVDAPPTNDKQAVESSAHKYFTDVELVNHHGETMRLYSDLLEGKVVIINSFFSTCQGSCPVMLSSFAKIQDRFRDRIGKDIYLISISVDPKTDSAEKLATYAQQWKAQDGWYFLTGEKTNVDTALYKLGFYVESKESHSNIFLIGNEVTGLWKKARGLSKPEELFPLIEEVLNDKEQQSR